MVSYRSSCGGDIDNNNPTSKRTAAQDSSIFTMGVIPAADSSSTNALSKKEQLDNAAAAAMSGRQIPIVCPGHTRPLAEVQFCHVQEEQRTFLVSACHGEFFSYYQYTFALLKEADCHNRMGNRFSS